MSTILRRTCSSGLGQTLPECFLDGSAFGEQRGRGVESVPGHPCLRQPVFILRLRVRGSSTRARDPAVQNVELSVDIGGGEGLAGLQPVMQHCNHHRRRELRLQNWVASSGLPEMRQVRALDNRGELPREIEALALHVPEREREPLNLVDIVLMARTQELAWRDLRIAVVAECERRGMAVPGRFEAPEFWRSGFARFARRQGSTSRLTRLARLRGPFSIPSSATSRAARGTRSALGGIVTDGQSQDPLGRCIHEGVSPLKPWTSCDSAP